MKVLVFTDLHENMRELKKLKRKAKDADIILCCGDFTVFGRSMKKMLKEIDSLGEVFLIHGNHEDDEEVADFVEPYENITFIHEKVVIVEDIAIIAYGGGGFSRTFPGIKPFISKAKRISSQARKRIVISHAPPYCTQIDIVHGEHVGNSSIMQLIKECKAQYAFSGHLHENAHVIDKREGVTFCNPGPDGEIFEI